MLESERKALVHEIKKRSQIYSDPKMFRITPKVFYREILPKFPVTIQETILRLCFEMTSIHFDKWVYLQLLPEWVDYDKEKNEESAGKLP